MSTSKHLSLQFNKYIFTLRVPAYAHAHEGRSIIRMSLGTGDRREAQRRRDILIGEYKAAWSKLKTVGTEDSTSWVQFHLDQIRSRARRGDIDADAIEANVNAIIERFIDARGGDPDAVPDVDAKAIREAVSAINDPHSVTLAAARDAYLAELTDRATPKTKAAQDKWLKTLVDHHGGHRPVRSFDRDSARTYVREYVAKLALAPSTKKLVFSYASAFSNWLVDAGYLHVNPLDGMRRSLRSSKKGEEKPNARRAYTGDELKAIFSCHHFPRAWHACALLLATGMRPGELVGLKVDDVVNEGKGLSIRSAKNASSVRIVPLPAWAQPLVTSLRDTASGELLVGGTYERLRQQFEVIREKALNLGTGTGRDLHSFRYTFRTFGTRSGIDSRVLDAIDGHKTPGSVGDRVYMSGFEFPQLVEATERVVYPAEVLALLRAPPTL